MPCIFVWFQAFCNSGALVCVSALLHVLAKIDEGPLWLKESMFEDLLLYYVESHRDQNLNQFLSYILQISCLSIQVVHIRFLEK